MALPGDREHDLVAKAMQGNQKAFRKILAEHHSMAYAVVRAILGDRDDIEDVLQNVFLKVYQGLPSFRGQSKLSTWIYKIARNEAINAVSKRSRQCVRVEEVEIPDTRYSNPDEKLHELELHDQLEKALSCLAEEQRMVLELRYLGRSSYSEIAQTMGIPIGTVKTHIYRGKVELKKILAKKLPKGR